jgi:3-hydroxybutyryl-CoA dehydrogenase
MNMDLKKIGVMGCGAMGAGIAQVSAQAGYEVVVSEVNDEALDRGLNSIRSWLAKGVAKGKLDQADMDQTLGLIRGTTDPAQFSQCDLIIEAAPEDLALKQKILAELDTICPAETILATNTSSLSIVDVARATGRPDKVVGLHFFNPVPLMRLCEVVRSVLVSEETVALAKNFGQSLGKTVIVARDFPGFIVNYLQLPFRLNAIRMLERGLASREDLDAAATLGLGHPMGPLTLQDMVGLDVTLAAAEAVYQATGDPMFKPPVLMQKMVAAGLLGRKTGRGFYDYGDQ